MRFQNVFLTGASSGLGRGLALHYAKAGATVFAAARRESELKSLAAELAGSARDGAGQPASSEGAGKIVPVPLDVGDLDALERAIRDAEARSGGALDLVIANAGIGEPTPAKQLDWRKVERVLHVNVSAACATLGAALPAMVARDAGTLAAVTSLAGIRGMAGHAAYSASKAALITFMESLRIDLRKTNVNALTIYPGFVKTPMTAKNKFKMPFILELDDAVARMARGIERGQRKIAFPFPLAASMDLMSHAPGGIYEWLAGKTEPKPRAEK